MEILQERFKEESPKEMDKDKEILSIIFPIILLILTVYSIIFFDYRNLKIYKN